MKHHQKRCNDIDRGTTYCGTDSWGMKQRTTVICIKAFDNDHWKIRQE